MRSPSFSILPHGAPASQSVRSQKSGPSRVEKIGGISTDQRIQTRTEKGLSRIVFSRHSFDLRHGPVNEPGEHSPGHSSKRARQRCRDPADARESPLRPGGQRPWRPATLRHAQTPLPNAVWRPGKEVGAFTPPVTNPASLLQSRRSLGGVGTRFGWICLDSPLLTRSRPHLPPPVPLRKMNPRLTRIGRIWSDSPAFGHSSLKPVRISRRRCTLR